MNKTKVSIIQFPGTNCEYDTKYAFDKLGAISTIVWHEDDSLPKDTDLVIIPGGFSYGDYLRSGSIARFSPIMSSVKNFASKGGYVLGICNGFQVLTEMGMIPGALKRNDNLHFISKQQHVKIINNKNIFLAKCREGQILDMPVAHADGNYYVDEKTLKNMDQNGQILLKYCKENGEIIKLNGSTEQIAGVCNKEKNVFALMPHPERAIEAILGSTDGIQMLSSFLRA